MTSSRSITRGHDASTGTATHRRDVGASAVQDTPTACPAADVQIPTAPPAVERRCPAHKPVRRFEGVMAAAPGRSVLIADEYAVARIGVRTLLAAAPEFTVIGEAGDSDTVIRLARATPPDLLVLDASVATVPTLETLRSLADESAPFRTVVLSRTIERRHIVEALHLGVRGIISRESVVEQLVLALGVVAEGGYWFGGHAIENLPGALRELVCKRRGTASTLSLTARERDVVAAIVEGCPNKDIAQRFSICEDTVKRHLTNIYDKTGASTRLELAMFAVHHRL